VLISGCSKMGRRNGEELVNVHYDTIMIGYGLSCRM
jgi:hypothetical protein